MDEDWMDPVVKYPGPPFEAHHDGECVECLEVIMEGETIRQVSFRDYAHALCVRRAGQAVIWE